MDVASQFMDHLAGCLASLIGEANVYDETARTPDFNLPAFACLWLKRETERLRPTGPGRNIAAVPLDNSAIARVLLVKTARKAQSVRAMRSELKASFRKSVADSAEIRALGTVLFLDTQWFYGTDGGRDQVAADMLIGLDFHATPGAPDRIALAR